MANLLTLIRLLLVIIIVALVEYAPPILQLLNVPLVIITMLLDVLDGIIARIRHETSLFGAVFDIAADRIIEITLWVSLIKSNLVPIWIPIIFIIRGTLVDSLRKKFSDEGKEPFSIMRTNLGQFLVVSRFMRSLYGALKLLTFSWLLFLLPAKNLWPDLWANNYFILQLVSNVLIYSTVLLCLLRGLPVIIEAIWLEKSVIFK
jgi:CDP-diacylglycerol---glycerol-3-phosphate 3-phosphatidyltransferase